VTMRIGEVLRELYQVREEDIGRALEIQKELGDYLGQILIQIGSVTERQLYHALSQQLGLAVFERDAFTKELPVDEILAFFSGKVDVNFIIEQGFVPIDIDEETGKVTFITNDPLNMTVSDYLQKSISTPYELLIAPERTLKEIGRFFQFNPADEVLSLQIEDSPERLRDMAFEAPIIKYLNDLVSRAVELNASDVHLEPSENQYRIRFRIDGVLQDIDSVKEEFYLALVSRIKLLSNLDIAEKRLPQDGKFNTRIGSTYIDVRVSTIPITKGEDVVIRLLYRGKLSFDLRTLGLMEDHFTIVRDMISKPDGMVLITGPTGSGKTTTLYSMLTSLNDNEKKIITIEDPVEYQLEGLSQIQVKSDIGFTFANALRSILRHDPDIIMVGEVRDKETAQISIQSALTGHLVLSTLHTNDAPSTLFRLLDMGVEDYLINASVVGVVAQRIVRQNCPYCTVEDDIPTTLVKEHELSELYEKFAKPMGMEMTFKTGKGCKKCAGTGYRGRLAVFELFELDEDLKEKFLKNVSLTSITTALKAYPYYRTLREDGMLKVIAGKTTVKEILRVT
jgi:general secretion pathway protein E